MGREFIRHPSTMLNGDELPSALGWLLPTGSQLLSPTIPKLGVQGARVCVCSMHVDCVGDSQLSASFSKHV